jgi:hypothetical protein
VSFPIYLSAVLTTFSVLACAGSGSDAAPEDRTPPAVAITRPANGVTLTKRVVTVWVKATDAGGVAKVALYVDGKPIATRTAMPWRFTWDVKKSGEGPHLLVAKAQDRAGNRADSAGVLVYPE